MIFHPYLHRSITALWLVLLGTPVWCQEKLLGSSNPAAEVVANQPNPNKSADANKQPVDFLITHGLIVTMNAPRTIYDDGAVAIKGDSIVAVGSRRELESQYTA